MARGRILANAISTSRKFVALHQGAGSLTEFAQLVYVLLVPHVDDCGRFPGDAFTVKLRAYPSSARSLEDFEAALVALNSVGLIHRYAYGGREFLAVTQFEMHQVFRHPPHSALPAPPGADQHARTSGVLSYADAHRRSQDAGARSEQVRAEVKEVKEVKKEKKDPARSRALFPSSVDYLEACEHIPPCETPRLCGDRRRLEYAVEAGTVSTEDARRLERLWLAERKMLPAPLRRRLKEEAS